MSESNIGGHDYLRNMVHLPFYLQNSGLRKVKVAQKSAQSHRKSVTVQSQYETQPETTLAVSVSETAFFNLVHHKQMLHKDIYWFWQYILYSS